MGRVRASLEWASPALVVLTSTGAVSAEPSLRILHDPIACVTPADFAVVRARTVPESGVDSLSVLLKSESDSPYSRIDMTRTLDGYAAVLPLPSVGSEEILYYLEAVNGPLRATTPVSRARVEQGAAECTTESLPVQGSPPEKKRRRGAFLALGAAGAAALGIGLLSGDTAETGSPSPPEPLPPVIPPIDPVPPTIEPVSACFELPHSAAVGASVRMDASCASPRGSISYEWNLGDGRSREGRVVTPSYSAPGLYVVELRVVRLTGATSSTDEDHTEKTILIVEGNGPRGRPFDGRSGDREARNAVFAGRRRRPPFPHRVYAHRREPGPRYRDRGNPPRQPDERPYTLELDTVPGHVQRARRQRHLRPRLSPRRGAGHG